MYAGSNDLVTSPFGHLILDKSVAFIDPSVIGNSYFLPVLLSMTVRVSLISKFCWEGANYSPKL